MVWSGLILAKTPNKMITITDFKEIKYNCDKIVCLTYYDFCSAKCYYR